MEREAVRPDPRSGREPLAVGPTARVDAGGNSRTLRRRNGRPWLGPLTFLVRGLVLSRFVGQRLRSFVAKLDKEDLVVLKELIEAGRVTPVIDRAYPLSEAPEAIRYLEAGHARGKVVITA